MKRLLGMLVMICVAGCAAHSGLINRKDEQGQSMKVTLGTGRSGKVWALYTQHGIVRDIENYRNSIMLNRIKVSNLSESTETLEQCSLEFSAKGNAVYTTTMNAEWLAKEMVLAYRYLQSPRGKMIAASNPFYRDPVSSNPVLAPGTSVMIFNQYFDLYAPEKLDRVTVFCRFSSGKVASGSFAIAAYEQKKRYIAPMKGDLAVIGGPYEIWGHRIAPATEFALDFVVLDKNLKQYSRDPFAPEEHHCFGRDILAPAEGTVMIARDGLPDNPKAYDRKAIGEFIAKYRDKFPKFQLSGGNHLIIDHGNNEYSYLVHLMNGSIKVKPDDKVKQGQVVARCGHSGEGSTSPHLHFHLADNAELDLSNGLPIRFDNIETTTFPDVALEKMGVPPEFNDILKSAGTQLWRAK